MSLDRNIGTTPLRKRQADNERRALNEPSDGPLLQFMVSRSLLPIGPFSPQRGPLGNLVAVHPRYRIAAFLVQAATAVAALWWLVQR